MPDDDDDQDFGFPEDDSGERFCVDCEMWHPVESFRGSSHVCDECECDRRYGPR